MLRLRLLPSTINRTHLEPQLVNPRLELRHLKMVRYPYDRAQNLGPSITESIVVPVNVYRNTEAFSKGEYDCRMLTARFTCAHMDNPERHRVEHSGLTRREGGQAIYSTVYISSSSCFYWPQRLKQLEPESAPWPELEEFLTSIYNRLEREYSWHVRQKGKTLGVAVMELCVDWEHDTKPMSIFRSQTIVWLAVWLHAFKVMADHHSGDATAQCRLILRQYGETVMLANTDPDGFVSVSWEMWSKECTISKIEDMEAFDVSVFTTSWPPRR